MSATNAQKFVAALVAPMQDLETLWHQMMAMRNLDNSVGVHLDVLGKIVGRRREGITDDDIYRRNIRAQVVKNKSNGLIDQLIQIAELIVYDDDAEYIVENTGVAALILEVQDVELDWTVAKALIAMLRRAVAGGVRIILRWWTEADEDDVFTFNGESDNSGFRAFDGSGGGALSSAME